MHEHVKKWGFTEETAHSNAPGKNTPFLNRASAWLVVIILLAISELEFAILELMSFQVGNMAAVGRVTFSWPRSQAVDGFLGSALGGR